MLLGGVFRANGTPQNLATVLSPQKAKHTMLDQRRWAAHYGVPIVAPPVEHPYRTVEALRATLAVSLDPQVIHGFFQAYWVHGRPPSERGVMADVLRAAGHDADAVLARIDDAAVKDDLRARTDEAIALGAFGAPTFVVDGKLWWGQDRMQMVEYALGGAGGAPIAADGARAPALTGHTVDFYFDFSSPYSYFGSTQAEALAARTGATLRVQPMLLGALFKAIGQVDAPINSFSPSKQRHAFEDMARCAANCGAPFSFPTRFPMNTVKALRAYLALPAERRAEFRERAYRAYWAEDCDLTDDATLRALIGADADAVLARTQTPEIKDALFAATKRAVDAGVFGAPTWVVDGTDLYFGHDRLALVEAALGRPSP
jgi:2-hydroxychromene-2-carboxylate isomerase